MTLFVSYVAVNEKGNKVEGYCMFTTLAVPSKPEHVERLCRAIEVEEKVTHVIPVFWSALDT